MAADTNKPVFTSKEQKIPAVGTKFVTVRTIPFVECLRPSATRYSLPPLCLDSILLFLQMDPQRLQKKD